jgi:hypothetical protein
MDQDNYPRIGHACVGHAGITAAIMGGMPRISCTPAVAIALSCHRSLIHSADILSNSNLFTAESVAAESVAAESVAAESVAAESVAAESVAERQA